MIDWSTVEKAIQSWVATSAGIAGTSVNWQYQRLGRPARPYADMNVISLRRLGVRDEQRASAPSPLPGGWQANTAIPANSSITVGSNTWWTQFGGTTSGSQPAELSASSPADGTTVPDDTVTWLIILDSEGVTLQTYGVREMVVSVEIFTDKLTGAGTARDLLSQAQMGLSRQSVLDNLSAAGLAVVGDSGLRDLSALVETAFEGRAQMDVTFGLSAQVADRIMSIDGVTLTDEIST